MMAIFNSIGNKTSELTIMDGGYIRTETANGAAFGFQAYDQDGSIYKTFINFINGNTPLCEFTNPGGATCTMDGFVIGSNGTPVAGTFSQVTTSNTGGSLYVSGSTNISATTASANIHFDSSTNRGMHFRPNVTGSFGPITFYNYVDSVQGSITCTGSGSTTYGTSSDYRLKENVIPLIDAVEKINLLNPVKFNFIGNEATLEGFIAHEVQAVVPQAVSGEKDAVTRPYRLLKAGKDIHAFKKVEESAGSGVSFEANAIYYWLDNDVVVYAMHGKNGVFKENLVLDAVKKLRASKAKNLLDDILADALAKNLIEAYEDIIEPQQLDMSHLVPLLVKAVQELSKEVENLKKK